jgi:hypothetical protein
LQTVQHNKTQRITTTELNRISTFAIVTLSGSSIGSAQSTITSQFHTLDLPDDNFRFAEMF